MLQEKILLPPIYPSPCNTSVAGKSSIRAFFENARKI
jgi:hypothetical protein